MALSTSPTGRKGSSANRITKSSQQKIETFLLHISENNPNINSENPLCGIEDSLIHVPGFFTQFIHALKSNTTVIKLIYPANKTIAQRESTVKELVTAMQREPSLGAVKCLKLITNICEDKIIEACIVHSTTLNSVSVKWCPLSVPIAQKWAEFLRNNSVLTSITLNVGREGGEDTDTCGMLLAEALQRNEHITTVKMRSNDFGEKSCLQFARVLTVNKTLTYLDLSSNRMGDKALVPFFKALKNSNLKTLILKDISIRGEEESARELADALKENKTLTKLNLFANSMDTVGAGLLAAALKFNFTLNFLDLYGNNIQNGGAEELGKMLKVNRGLEGLILQSNGISEIGVGCVAEGLHGNGTLRSLNIAANSIGKSDVALAKLIVQNTTLTKLDMRFTDAKKHQFEDALKNRTVPLDMVWLY